MQGMATSGVISRIAGYIVVDKLALEHMPAVVLNEASNIGNMLDLSWAVRKGSARRVWAVNRKTILLGAVLGVYILKEARGLIVGVY
jgi:hypothetical protein